MRTLLLAPLPVVLVAMLVIVASLPWGGPDWMDVALSLLPIAAIHFWSVRWPWLMPSPVVLVLGLLEDVVTHGPLGVWGAAALVAALSGRLAQTDRGGAGAVALAVRAMVTLLVVVCLVGAVTSLQGWRLVPWATMFEALLAACAAYPVLATLLSSFERLWPVREDRTLLLRGD